MRESRADLFDEPNGTTVVPLAFFANECGSGAFENPDVNVGGLFADDRSDDTGDASEFNLDAVVRCFVTNASDGKWVFALGCDDNMDEARLGGGCHHREAGRSSFRV